MRQRFLTLLTMLLMCSVALVKAETIEIGVSGGEPQHSDYLPAYAYYNYSLSQQIYTAAEIGGAGNITSIAYNYTGAVSDTRQITIYMVNTDKTSFTSTTDFVQVTAEDVVYDGPAAIVNGTGWYSFSFETPFEYTGENLLIICHDHTGSYKSGMTCQVYDAEENTAICTYNDNSNPDPTTNLSSFSGSKSRLAQRNVIRLEKEAAAPVTCPRPEMPVISDITTESAVVTWTAVAGVSAYEIALVEAGEEFTWEDQGILWEEEELSLPIEFLMPNTSYDFYLRSYCSEEDQSAARKVTFRTACGVLGLPWSENFDELSAGKLDLDCWSNEQTVGTNNKYASVASGHLNFPYTSTGGQIRVTTPVLDVPAANEYEFSISANRTKGGSFDGTNYYSEGVHIIVLTAENEEVEIGFVPKSADSELGVGSVAAAGWYTYQFTIPVSGVVNFILQWDSKDGLGFDVDNLSIRKIPTCFPPSNLHAGEATLNSVSFAWTPFNEDNLNAHIVVKAGEEVVVDALVNDSVYTIEGLEHSHIYNYSVTIHTVCDEEESTDAYTANITLATLCAPISAIPWAENFETTATNTLPVCWTTADNASYPYISSSTYSAPEGEKYLYFYGGSTYYGVEYVAMPELGAEIDINTLELSFLFKQSSVGTSYPQLVVGVMSDPTDLETFIAVQTLEQTNEVTEIEVDFVNVPATHKYIAFKVPVVSSATTFYVDDVQLTTQPTCIKPTNIALGEVTDNAATITWEGDAEQYELYLVVGDLDGEVDEDGYLVDITENVLIVNGHSYTLENLLPVRNYGVLGAIRAICAEGDTSKIVTFGEYDFRTAIPESYTEVLSVEHDELAVDFANAEEAAKWIILYGSGYNNFVVGEGAKAEMGNTALYVSNNGSNYAYTNNSSSASAASRLIEIPAADSVRISFDWLAKGEAGWDYGRVAIMPADMDENALFASSIPSEVIVLADKLQSQTTVQHFSATLEDAPAGRYKLVFGWKNDSSGGSNPPLAVANVNVKLYAESALSCKKVSDIHVAEVGSDYAVIAWAPGKDEAAWVVTLYMADENGELAELGEMEVEEPALRIEDMETATSYQFLIEVKASCGDERYSKPVEAEISFTTDVPADAVTIINEENPTYAADFNTNWFIMNSTGANHFVIGNKDADALLNGAETALYVSNDEDGTYAYTNNSFSVAAAYHRIDLEVAADTLVIDFDWLANGEGGWDYGLAFLTPAAMDIQMLGDNPFLYIDGTIVSPGSAYNVCPAGAIDLGNGKLNLATSVQHKSVTLTNVPAGAYKLIFAWGNDGSTGNNKPLSICNVNVEMHQRPVYTLSYVVDGQTVETAQYHAGDAVTATELVPVKEGYTFAQWDAVPALMPENDVTVNAVFTVNSYDLVFKATWGAGHEIVVSDTQVEFGAAITAPEAPEVEGYTFTAWGEYPETMPARDVYVYGSYTINSYTLTVVVNGITLATQTLPYGTPLAPLAAAAAAQVPEGWEITSISEYPETMPANDLTINVTAAPIQVTVTVVAENGTVEGAGTYNWGTEVTLTATPAEGYEFKGWSDENTENPRTITVKEDVTLTAVFEAKPVEGLDNIGINGLQVINRTIVANEAIRIYTVAGQEVTAMNGNLVNGIYVVKGESTTAKITIR